MLLFVALFSAVQGDLNGFQEEAEEPVIITVDSTNFRFSPSSVTVNEGDTVRFFWSGQAIGHNAVEENGQFDSGEPARDVDYSFTFEVGMNGTYAFVCEPHESMGMVGQIVVKPISSEPDAEPETPGEANDTPALSMVFTMLSVIAAALLMVRRQGNG
jgi:plastocyanin